MALQHRGSMIGTIVDRRVCIHILIVKHDRVTALHPVFIKYP